MSPVLLAFLGTTFTFLATAVGAGTVYLFRKEIPQRIQRIFLGFAAGVMIAASVWSLLIPAMEMAEEQNMAHSWLPAAGGFVLGGVFLLALDHLLPHMHPGAGKAEGVKSSFTRTTMLVLAVTLHNIPEGLAVGLAFGMAGESSAISLSGALALSVGMALQNFPEGAAISLPLKKEGLSNNRSFLLGALSGIVEPIAGVTGVLVAGSITGIMPWFLAFAAGAMIYVVVEELIPVANLGEHSHTGTLSVMAGFLVMMILDIALA
ncbi:MAG: ZIP family metal transporter [Clostridia bacterium]|nr:ZIP family metal transporter [Clostridia bacterium]